MSSYKQDNNKSKIKHKSFPHRNSSGNFDINYDTFELKIPNYIFAKPIELNGAGSLIAISLGKRLTDNKPILAKISPHLIRLEREYYLSKRIYPLCPQNIPQPIEYVSLPQNGLAVLLYSDVRPDDFLYFQNNYHSLYSICTLPDKSTTWPPEREPLPCKAFTLDVFLKFAIECCSVLQFLHENGVIHGELRPSAFYCHHDQDLDRLKVKIWNFGGGLKSYEDLLLTRWRSLMADKVATTINLQDTVSAYHYRLYSSKELQSSLVYVSPEQTGRTSNVIDHRADLYSLGIMFFILLTNRAPFEGTAMDIIEAILSKNVPFVHNFRKDIPPVISLIIDKLTRKSVDERYDSAYGLKKDLLECQKRLENQAEETLVFFPLGQHDVNPVFKIADGVYGREKELEQIRNVIDRVSVLYERSKDEEQFSQSEIIVLRGPGGIGKSTLASVIHIEARQSGYTATAKFDKNQKSPYNGLLRCLSSILRQLLTEPESVVKDFYRELKDNLGPQFSNVRLLVSKVPELKPILYDYKEKINPVDDDALSSILNTEIRFHSVFLSIIRIIARRKMTTLCLDDLQEADEPSINLIRVLIRSRIAILIILTFRDGDETPQSIIKILENTNDHTVTNIQLQPLSIDILQELVRHTFYSTYDPQQLDIIRPLVDLIYTWTRGNPFFAKQFLRIMKRKDDIWFDWNDKNWKFRLDNKKHQSIFDVRQLVSHLKSLDTPAQALLMWASLIGHVFNFRKIKWLMQEEAMTGLQTALNEGIVQYKAGDDFNFTHDRYCQAASMLIVNDGQREKMHFKIGQMLMAEEEEEEEEEADRKVFWVADHLLKSANLIRLCDKTRCFREVLIKAGNEATAAGAPQTAVAYYECAFSLLPQDRWRDGPDSSFEETLNLYIKLLELINCSSLGANKHDQMVQEVLGHTQDYPLERVQVWCIQARACFRDTNYRQGIDILLNGLSELGVIIEDEAMGLYHRVKSTVNSIGFDALNKLRPCKDSKRLATMVLLNEGCMGAYWLDPNLADILGLKICELSLDSGYTSSSGGGFVWAGCTAARLMEFSFAIELGKIGMTMAKKYAGNSEIARAIIVYHSMLAQWTGVPIHQYFEQFQKAYTYAVAAGDGLYSSLALFHASTTLYWTGRHLTDIRCYIEKSLDESKRNRAKDVLVLNTSLLRSVLVFQGKTDSLLDSKTMMNESGIFDETTYVNNLKSQSSGNALSWHYSCKIILLFHFGFYKEAADSGFEIFNDSLNGTIHRHIGIAIYYHSLAIIECLRDKNFEPEVREKYKAQLDAHKENFSILASYSNVNYGLNYKILCAQLSTLEDNLKTTLDLFNKAIEHSQKDNWISVLGFVHELVAQHYIRVGLDMLALPMLEKSIDCYRQWGAYGKVKYLQRKYKHLFDHLLGNNRDCGVQTEDVIVSFTANVNEGNIWDNTSDETATDPSLKEANSGNEESSAAVDSSEKPEATLFSLDMVDLTSIIKSSQVISNEMNSFDELLKRMIGIIMANAGAESGAIIIKEGQFGIAAYSTRTSCETYDPPHALEDDKLPTSIIHYVIHTHSVLFIPNVEDDPRFVTNINKSSVICMPILHKNTLVGILYLQASVSTFTYKHVNVLTLLCDQIGISITNALLFKSLQKATQTNAQMIETQLKALEEARASREQALRATKMKSNFLANMSHELRTPFSGFYGMISLLSETSLDAEQREFVSIAKQSCEMLLHIIDDLLDFSKLEAHKVKLHYGLCYVEDIIADRLELLITLATNKNVELSYFIDKDVPPIIYADGNRIGQVLLNLIGNAIKFTHYGEVVVHCSVDKEQLDDDDLLLKISVRDTGIGMSEEEIKGLFLPFSQVDGSTTRNFGGTGLGLSICLQLVKLMQGDIHVVSSVNNGSTFSFTVRVKNGATVVAEPDGDSRSKTIQDLSAQLGQPRILTVCQTSMKGMLEDSLPWLSLDHQYSIDEATRRIFEKVQCGTPYDCIVVDAPLPDALKQLITAVESKPGLGHTRILLLIAPAVDNVRRANISPKPSVDIIQHHFLFHPLVTRMSKPIRQLKLLNSLVKALSQHEEPPALNEPADFISQQPIEEAKPVSSFSTSRQTLEGFSPEELAIFKGQKILVAEDNFIAQKLVVKQLGKLGFVVETCNNGFECFDTWKARGPGYFLLAWIDHHMPGCDGIEATKKIRAYEKKMKYEKPLPIIALTADIQATAQENCIQAGMNDYVTKPLMQKDLAIILRKYCFNSVV